MGESGRHSNVTSSDYGISSSANQFQIVPYTTNTIAAESSNNNGNQSKAGGGGARRSSHFRSWSLNDASELKRKSRVASYKVYTMEGKVKSSFRKGLTWIKSKCVDLW